MTLLDWQKRITRRVFVDSEGLRLGDLTGMLADMWEEAQSQASGRSEEALLSVLAWLRGYKERAEADLEALMALPCAWQLPTGEEMRHRREPVLPVGYIIEGLTVAEGGPEAEDLKQLLDTPWQLPTKEDTE